mgnify:CR=1 FL=1
MPDAEAAPVLPTRDEYQATRRQIMFAVGGSLAAAALGAGSLLAGERIKALFEPRPVAGEVSCPPVIPPPTGSGS